jgi:hypothetical protein
VDHRADAVARVRRVLGGATYETKTVLARYPAAALPVQRIRRHGEVVGDATEIVIESFRRCASTFAVAASRLAQEPRPMTIAHHTHMPAQVLQGARRRLPILVLSRAPEGEIEADYRCHVRDDELERTISRPSEERRAHADQARTRLDASEGGVSWRRAQDLYRRFAAVAGA